jgi:hypothetical protein
MINPVKILVRKAEKVYVVMHYGEYVFVNLKV